MRQLPLNAIRAFTAVYTTGGIRPAARLLEVTHSSVSRHIRELEDWLGAPLFETRDGRRSTSLTPHGRAFAQTASRSLAKLEKAVAIMREGRKRNSVRLNTSPSVANRWVLPRLPAFAAAHPNVELSIIAEQAVVDSTDVDADFFIRMGKGPWNGLAATSLMDDALYPVMSPGYWKTAGRPSQPAHLAKLRLLHDRDPQASWAEWKAAYGPRNLDIRSGPRLTSSDMLIEAAMQGAGVALARHRLAATVVASGALVRPLGDLEVRIKNAYWILTPAKRAISAVAAQTIRWFQTAATDLSSS